ncbi:flagellar export chaperone FlgN, partial [Escherichia coli]|uniref:flagellar export chaperone FlgN n=1 Tax=Escherichia coli TaxID=562 RepID=UPI001CED617F
MMSLWDALRMNMMISYQELVRTFLSQRWQEITVKTQQLRQMNQHNGWLLEGQIERNQQALEMLKPHQEPTLYGANGQTSTTHRGGKKISI